jgi:hypothetical protein
MSTNTGVAFVEERVRARREVRTGRDLVPDPSQRTNVRWNPPYRN